MGFRILGVGGLRVLGFEVQDLGCRIGLVKGYERVSGLEVKGLGLTVWGKQALNLKGPKYEAGLPSAVRLRLA